MYVHGLLYMPICCTRCVSPPHDRAQYHAVTVKCILRLVEILVFWARAVVYTAEFSHIASADKDEVDMPASHTFQTHGAGGTNTCLPS